MFCSGVFFTCLRLLFIHPLCLHFGKIWVMQILPYYAAYRGHCHTFKSAPLCLQTEETKPGFMMRCHTYFYIDLSLCVCECKETTSFYCCRVEGLSKLLTAYFQLQIELRTSLWWSEQCELGEVTVTDEGLYRGVANWLDSFPCSLQFILYSI